jgi:hypothetical protein
MAQTCVKWGNQMSHFFLLRAGVRQEGVLSPLFSVYIDGLVDKSVHVMSVVMFLVLMLVFFFMPMTLFYWPQLLPHWNYFLGLVKVN